MLYGMSYDEFWNGKPELAVWYRKKHRLEIEQRNQELWLQGLYFNNAVSVALNNGFNKKKIQYIDKPIRLFPETEDEKKAEAEREKDEELKALKRRVAISDNAKSFLKSGYDADNAEKAATALYDGDNETFFSIQQSVMESARKSAIADKMNKTPDPDRGEQGTGARDYEKEIETAKEAGNFALAASLMSQQYEENQNNGGNS
jgi:hypothetical protein